MGMSAMHSDAASVPPERAELYRRIHDAIAGAASVAICGHTSPDGDALGSGLALGSAIRQVWPGKEVVNLLADDGCVPRIYRFLDGADRMVPAARYEGDPDLFIAVDCPVLDRLADGAAVARRAGMIASFDHHPSRGEFCELSVRNTSSAAAAVIIDEFLVACGMPITPGIATSLFCGVVTDTGRFQYQNANPAAFCCASHLVAAGAEPARISLEVYQSQRIEYLRVESLVMSRIKTFAHGRVAYSYARAEDLSDWGVSQDECDGLVDVVRSVMGVEVCLFLKEVEGGRVRGNLRSKGSLDVSGIAAVFGGGGHPAAAGFTYEGTIDDALGAAMPLLVELVGESVAGVVDEL